MKFLDYDRRVSVAPGQRRVSPSRSPAEVQFYAKFIHNFVIFARAVRNAS